MNAKGCKYCDSDIIGNYSYPFSKTYIYLDNGTMEIKGNGKLLVWSKDDYGVWKAPQTAEIEYCPMCGRKLEEANG